MTTTTPVNASDLYKSQITEIAVPSPANKAAAVLLTPINGKQIFVNGSDGGWFTGVTGLPLATLADNGGAFCGTEFIPTGGDGSAGWERDYDKRNILLQWYGILPANSAAANTPLFQVAVNIACNNSLVIKNTLESFNTNPVTTPASTSLHIFGEAYSYLRVTPKRTSRIIFTGTAATVEYLFKCGNNAKVTAIGNIFETSDVTEQWGIFQIGALGAGAANQSIVAGYQTIKFNSFNDIGGTAAAFGGECYGVFSNNVGQSVAQVYVNNGSGEMQVNENQFQDFINSSFTPESGNIDAVYVSIASNTKFKDNVNAGGNDTRPFYYCQNCQNIIISGNKSERSGLTTPTTDVFLIENTSAPLKTFIFENNPTIQSSATGTFAGRQIKFLGTAGQIYSARISGNDFVYGTGAAATASAIDCTTNAPRQITLSDNFRGPSDVSLAQFSDGYTSSSAQQLLGNGINGDDVDFITVHSNPFTVLATQTGTTVVFDYQNDAIYLKDNLMQILPVSVSVQCDGDPLDTVTFYLSLDTAKADSISVSTGPSVTKDQGRFALRSVYILSPDQIIDTRYLFYYDSGASASTTVEYRMTFTYMIINDPQTSRFKKFPIDVV